MVNLRRPLSCFVCFLSLSLFSTLPATNFLDWSLADEEVSSAYAGTRVYVLADVDAFLKTNVASPDVCDAGAANRAGQINIYDQVMRLLAWTPDPNRGKLLETGDAVVTCGVTNDADPVVALFEVRTPVTTANSYNLAGGNYPVWNRPMELHPASWSFTNLGNVFGIAVDRDRNILTTASSSYSPQLNLLSQSNGTSANVNFSSGTGAIGRAAAGPNATAELNAAGTIYKLDAVTGNPSVFAVLPQQATTATYTAFIRSGFTNVNLSTGNRFNTGPGLGNIVYDRDNDQFFVTNFEDGKIYRISADGTVQPTAYDFGTPDNGAAGMPPLQDRVWGVGIYDGRLYYSVWTDKACQDNGNCGNTAAEYYDNGPNPTVKPFIRSLAIDPVTGDFQTATDRLEYDGSDLEHTAPISDIAFDAEGNMLIAQKTMLTDYAGYNHRSQVAYLTGGNGAWTADPFFTGPRENPTNANRYGTEAYGGVAFGYNGTDIDATIWYSSADMVRDGNITNGSQGPHGIAGFLLSDLTSDFPDPRAIVPYDGAVISPSSIDLKGSGGDIEIVGDYVSLGNLVWEDTNDNGLLDGAEAGIPGVTVNLLNAAGTVILLTTTTNAAGQYLFTDLLPGDYIVEVIPPAGYNSSTGSMFLLETGASEPAPDPDMLVAVDSDDNGTASGTAIRSAPVTLEEMQEPEGETGLTGLTDFVADNSANYTVDFGLIPPCDLSITTLDVQCSAGTTFAVSFNVEWTGINASAGTISVSVDGTAQAPIVIASSTGSVSYGPVTVDGPAYGVLIEVEFTDVQECSATTAVDLIACTPDCVDGSGTIGGNVFNDFDNNGADAGAGEVGQENVLVEVYDCDGVLVCSTYTNADGNWSCDGLTDGEEYRVEFSTPLQPYLQPSFAGDDNGTNVQFVMGGNCNIDYGVYDPAYCLGETDGDANSDDKRVLVTCFVNGAADGAGIEDVLVAFDYDESGSDPTDHLATKSEMGSVWALAYDPARDVAYTSAFTKRHVGMGPNGPGAIYQYDFTTNTTSLFIDLAAAGLDVSGFPDELTRNLGDAGGTSRDPDVFDLVGKTAIGDIDITVDGSTLYAMSLANKTVYEIDVATQSVTNTYASDGPGCTNGEWRPFALKVHEGKVYVGGVCDASNGGTNADLQASVFVLVDGAFIEVVSVPLDYRKGRVHATAAPTLGNWRPWVDAFSDLTVGFNAQNQAGRPVIVHPQPILSDMEFDVDGSLILGFMDRSGHQVGNENLSPGGAANIRWTVISGGDILRAAADGQGGYTLESNGTAGSTTTAGAGNNQGPDGGEFYYGDRFFDADNSLFVHQETSLGGLALLPGTGEVLLSVFDPVNGGSALYGSAGVSKLSNTTGNKDNAAGRIVYTQTDTGTFGKGNGLGDLEIICSPPPIQIGNYAWIDTDEDGIQDACEPPLPDLTVKLYTKPATGDPVLLATTTTDANGNYYFVGDQLDNATWAVSDTIAAGEQYFIAFCGDNAFNDADNTIEVDGVTYCLTTADTGEGTNPDLNDSDATVQDILGAMIPAYCTQPGEVDTTNHTIDVGWKPVITCDLQITAVTPVCTYNPADGQSTFAVTVNVAWDYPDLATTNELINVTFANQTLTIDPASTAVGTGMVEFTGVAGPAYSQLVTAAFAVPPSCSATGVVDLIACTPDCVDGTGTIGGNVFNDFNNDGADAGAGEVGQANVLVEVYDCDGLLVCSTYTNADGNWACDGLTDNEEYRVEFSTPLQPYLQPSFAGVDNGTNTQFTTAPSCAVDYGVVNPADYCEGNPLIITTCYIDGTAVAQGNGEAVVDFDYNASGTAAPITEVALGSEVGATWGLAFDASTQTLYVSEVLRRHSGTGTGAQNGIYTIDLSAGTPAAPILLMQLPAAGGVPRTLANSPGTPAADPDAFAEVAKSGIGDIDLSIDGQTLYVTNLDQTRVDIVDIASATVTSSISFPDLGCTLRPWAVKVKDGEVYAGAVCEDQLRAYVFQAVNNVFVPLDLNTNDASGNYFDLSYQRESAWSLNPTFVGSNQCNFNQLIPDAATWHTWINTFPAPICSNPFGSGEDYIIYPQPILADIEFDEDGSIILGFLDRMGMQGGFLNVDPDGNGSYVTIAAGDIIRICATADGFAPEGTAGCPQNDTGNDVGYVPEDGGTEVNEALDDGAEFYNGDDWLNGNGNGEHYENSLGGLALRIGTGEILTGTYDPITGNFNAGGIRALSNTTGDSLRGLQLYGNGDVGTFAKAAGIGDLELICDPLPIQIGNYAWIDEDEDGIQDACEPPLPGLTVKLYRKDGANDPVQIASTLTDANGNYYFSSATATDPNLTWTGTAADTSLQSGQQYFVAFCGDNAFNDTDNTIEVDGVTYCLTTADTGEGTNPDLNDSDATVQDILGAMIPAYCTQPGEVDTTNHTFDVGWKPVITCVQPTVLAFAIQPSCESDGTVNADGYLLLSEVTGGLSYAIDDGTGTGFGSPTDLTGASYPLQILTGLANPATDQDYTIRVYEDAAGASTCFTDVVVTLRVQDCTIGCNCEEFIYLNEVNGPEGVVHKFKVNPDGSLDEIFNDGGPWFSGPELPSPHGLGTDLNGFVYIGENAFGGDIRRLSCDGELVPESEFSYFSGGQFNVASIGNTVYYNPVANNDGIVGFDVCTGMITGTAQYCEAFPFQDWGFYIDPRTELMYATSNFGAENNDNYLWIFSEADFDNDPATCISAVTLSTPLPNGDIRGVVTDELGNIYIAVQDNTSLPGSPSMLLKYGPGPGYPLLAQSTTDAIDDGTGFNRIIGLVFSETTQLIYASTEAFNDDCVSIFNTNLQYLGTAVPAPGNGANGKGIAITKECCPTNNNQVVEIVQCNQPTNEPIFLNQIFPCDGGLVCEAQWQPIDAEAAAVYNPCNQSIMAGIVNGCYTFVRSSDGTGASNQCGAFTQTFTVSVGEVTASVVGGDQEICEGEDPAAFTEQTAASGSGPLSYQWSVSTQSDSTGFTIIPGATSAIYDPTPADITADTVYFRQVVTVEGCVDGSCADTSNTVIVITVYDCLSLGSTVFVDNNNNGFQDTDDLGIPGVEVQLWDATTMMQILTDANGVPVTNPADAAMVLTDANGDYLFSNLPEGDYYVVIPTAPISAPISSNETSSGFMETDPDDNLDNDDEGVQPGGSGASVSSDTITLTVGDEPTNGTTDGTETAQGNTQDDAFDANGNMTLDFGFFAPVTVGDTTFVDLDGDGLQGPDDAPLGNVTVTVYDNATGMPVTLDAEDMAYTATQTTAADGSYLFENLPPGDYYVEFDLSTADNGLFYDYTTPNAGDDADDSDAVPAAPEDDVASSGPTGFLTSGGSDLTLDAGVQCAITVTVADPFTICSTQPIDLTQNVSISPVSLSFGGSWTSSGNGTFLNSVGGELSDDPDPIAFGEAVTYVPGSQDIRNGFVILTLTTDDPDGPCEPVSASVRIEILKVDCGEFLWDGQ